MTWDEAVAYALSLGDAELGTAYRQPAVKVNGRSILNVGGEPDTSFVLHLELPLTEMLCESHPATFWKTAHYEGWPSLLVRYDGPDDDLVRELIGRAREEALAKKPPRPRKT